MDESLHHLPLREIVVFLLAAGVLIPLGHRLRLNPVLGYLLLGVLLGPHGLGRLVDAFPPLGYVVLEHSEGAHALAELGVLFLLFAIGLELSLGHLWSMRRLVLGLGGAQITVCGAAIGLVALVFANPPGVALVLGLTLALSSTAIVMGLFAEAPRAHADVRRTGFAILLMQDLAVVPILLLTALLAGGEGEGIWWALLRAVLAAVGVIALILGLGRLLLRPLFELIGTAGRRDLLMAAVLLVIILTALATAQAGLSAALGAFLAGLLLAETAWRHEIDLDLDPFKGLLMGLFFLSIGMGLDLEAALAFWPWLLVSVPGLILVKAMLTALLARAFGLPWAVAVETGLLLGQAGEFAFVVLGVAQAGGLIRPDTAAFMLVLAGTSMLLTPLLADLAHRAGRRAAAFDADRQATTKAGEGRLLIAGYGRIGRLLAAVLKDEAPVLALDRDPAAVAAARGEGIGAWLGDASRPDLLRRAGVAGARALVVTMDDPAARARVVATARRHWPNLPLVVRARDAAEARLLRQNGRTWAVPETLAPALELGEAALDLLDVPDERKRRLVEAARERQMRGPEPG